MPVGDGFGFILFYPLVASPKLGTLEMSPFLDGCQRAQDYAHWFNESNFGVVDDAPRVGHIEKV